MKKLLFSFAIFAFLFNINVARAQDDIIDADEDVDYNHYYEKKNFHGRSAIPYPYLRESDVVWETAIWRKVDFREKFNQFFYFPTSTTENTQDRINLTNALLQAWENGDVEAYLDDDLKKPADYTTQMKKMGEPTRTPIMIEDEDGVFIESGEYKFDTSDFNVEQVLSIKLKEFWYIDKQDTRQKVRIVGLALVYNYCRSREGSDGEEASRTCGDREVAWFPMNDMRVRNVLVKARAYDERNINSDRSYDDIFIDRFFDSYVLRESNRFNRTIASYTVGEDALLLSQEIENRIYDIESDMWEY